MNEPMRILVVDDEPDIVEILSYNLRKNNFAVFSANNGEDCLKVAEETHPDLIILDIRMPGMTGIETCRKLRLMSGFSKTPVLFLTADSDEYITMSAFEAGGSHFITKPVRPAILVNMIKELIN
ncbi:MAG: response regulator [Bacteroidia bacterium]